MDHGRHSTLSFLSSLPISVLRVLDTEANKFYDRNHKLYDAALLTRCYTQHALRPVIDSEINHKRHFIKIPFINKGIEFIDLPSIFKDRSVTSSIPAYFQNSRYLDDLLNIDNPYFEGMVNRIYPPELQLNKANTSDNEAPFLDLHLSISNGLVSSKIYDKRDDFDFDIVNFPFLDGDVPRSTSYGVYISQLIRFARASSHVVDFNARNKS